MRALRPLAIMFVIAALAWMVNPHAGLVGIWVALFVGVPVAIGAGAGLLVSAMTTLVEAGARLLRAAEGAPRQVGFPP